MARQVAARLTATPKHLAAGNQESVNSVLNHRAAARDHDPTPKAKKLLMNPHSLIRRGHATLKRKAVKLK